MTRFEQISLERRLRGLPLLVLPESKVAGDVIDEKMWNALVAWVTEITGREVPLWDLNIDPYAPPVGSYQGMVNAMTTYLNDAPEA